MRCYIRSSGRKTTHRVSSTSSRIRSADKSFTPRWDDRRRFLCVIPTKGAKFIAAEPYCLILSLSTLDVSTIRNGRRSLMLSGPNNPPGSSQSTSWVFLPNRQAERLTGNSYLMALWERMRRSGRYFDHSIKDHKHECSHCHTAC